MCLHCMSCMCFSSNDTHPLLFIFIIPGPGTITKLVSTELQSTLYWVGELLGWGVAPSKMILWVKGLPGEQ